MVRDIKAQYKQALLGYAWILVVPLAQLGILTFVFTTAIRITPNREGPFSLFLLTGLLPWNFFVNAVTGGTGSLLTGANVLKSLFFPRELIVIAAVLIRIVDLAASLLILAVLVIWSGQHLSWNALWLPPLFFIHLTFIVGIALPLAACNLHFRDTRFLVGTALSLLFFLTPIFYSSQSVPSQYAFVYDLNPNARLIEAYRWALLQNVAPPLESLIWAGVLSVATLIVGYWFFKKMEPTFADYV
jgi:ABC-type polysaccharide/polyol phosphate export permease